MTEAKAIDRMEELFANSEERVLMAQQVRLLLIQAHVSLYAHSNRLCSMQCRPKWLLAVYFNSGKQLP